MPLVVVVVNTDLNIVKQDLKNALHLTCLSKKQKQHSPREVPSVGKQGERK